MEEEMTRLRLANKLEDCDKPDLKKLRHKISKKEIEEYFTKVEDEDESN